MYDDGEVENLDMKKERWELIEDDDAEADDVESRECILIFFIVDMPLCNTSSNGSTFLFQISLQEESGDESSEATPEP